MSSRVPPAGPRRRQLERGPRQPDAQRSNVLRAVFGGKPAQDDEIKITVRSKGARGPDDPPPLAA